MLRFWDRISYPLWSNFESAVRAGEGQRQFSRFSEEEQQLFSAGVEAFSAGAALALAESYDFGHHRRVLSLSRYAVAASDEPYRMLSPMGDTPHPAVLLVPGCSGFAATNGASVYEERALELQAAGYFVVFVDYIGRRMQTNCAHVLQTDVSDDILDAARWIRGQAGVDAGRISVIGWSYGGGGVLAALKIMSSEPPIAKAVLYYPVCRGASSWSTNVAGLILLGEIDDIALPALYASVAKGMPSDRPRVITFPNARHGFDMRSLPVRADLPSESPGYNDEAANALWMAVLEFLK